MYTCTTQSWSGTCYNKLLGRIRTLTRKLPNRQLAGYVICAPDLAFGIVSYTAEVNEDPTFPLGLIGNLPLVDIVQFSF